MEKRKTRTGDENENSGGCTLNRVVIVDLPQKMPYKENCERVRSW